MHKPKAKRLEVVAGEGEGPRQRHANAIFPRANTIPTKKSVVDKNDLSIINSLIIELFVLNNLICVLSLTTTHCFAISPFFVFFLSSHKL
jgi:hypothetical protein